MCLKLTEKQKPARNLENKHTEVQMKEQKHVKHDP